MPTEGLRSMVNVIQIGILFAIILFLDIIFVKNTLLFIGVLGVDLAVCGVLLSLVIKDIQKYFDY
ncbi:hypothetical protein GWK48_06770 [Metallosphaera tengchongensis]|uniref:Uncharacterized protein n=1 Tax=Metallosphaera tengchongensis TaxID=1532350 RepID=A0A6N0NTM0_9CREN|nr:hypothetical protein [Metallosphaera tengchongensis]QKR00116.1 hypothetical protein GWK48_06770 [Metallosphaera tengchongensis]